MLKHADGRTSITLMKPSDVTVQGLKIDQLQHLRWHGLAAEMLMGVLLMSMTMIKSSMGVKLCCNFRVDVNES